MTEEVNDVLTENDEDLQARLDSLEKVEKAIDGAFNSGKKERAKVTQEAQLDAAEAVAMVGIALESDVAADEARRITAIAEGSGDRERIKAARKKEREIRKKAKADHKAATESAKQAYDAIKFSDPNSMGFMRVVQIVFAIHIASTLVLLILTSRDTVSYSFANIMDWVMVVLEGVSFFFFINRYKAGRPFAICMALIGIIVPTIASVASGNFS